MRRGIALGVIGMLLALTGSAQAQKRTLRARENAAITAYAATQHGYVSNCGPGLHRKLACTVTVPLYLQPSGLLFGYDSATIVAFRDQGAIYMIRVGSWMVSQTAPGFVITGSA